MKGLKISQSITDRQDASLGIFFKEVSKIPMIDINKEIELSRRVKEGDELAANELVKANLRFVISVAKQYQNKGLPLVDLIQEGCLGLIQASKLYDESKGFKFISFAVWWIRQAIMKAITDQCRTVRIPMNQVAYISKINKVMSRFEQEEGRKPSIEELEDITDLSSAKISSALLSTDRTISLDMPFKDEETGCLIDIIPNENSEASDKNIVRTNNTVIINEVLSNLSYRERDIIRMTYGIEMNPMQNEEIANRFGISCERVRQIQKEAIEKIRTEFSDDLRELL